MDMQMDMEMGGDSYGDEYYDEEMEGMVGVTDSGDYQQAYAYAAAPGQQQLYVNAQGVAVPISTTGIESSSGDALIAEGYEFLEEELDDNYEPKDEEIEEYAKYLGMDLVEDRDLFYIAKEGLKAPLPGPWKPCKDPNGDIWYYNFDTKEIQKDHPCDDYYRKYYLNEKSSQMKKKEEAVIKKQIKKQKKQQ